MSADLPVVGVDAAPWSFSALVRELRSHWWDPKKPPISPGASGPDTAFSGLDPECLGSRIV